MAAGDRSRDRRARRAAGIGLKSFAKTTGGKGLHVVVPLTPKLGWDEVKAFAKWVADSFVAQRPEDFTANMAKRARHGRIYIDYLRNGRGATAVGAYTSARAAGRPGLDPALLGGGREGREARRVHGRDCAAAARGARRRPLGGDRKDPPIDQRRGTSAGRDLIVNDCERPARYGFVEVPFEESDMPRASWNGFLRLSLVSCPVALVPATTEAKRVRFNQLNSETGNRVQQQLVDSQDRRGRRPRPDRQRLRVRARPLCDDRRRRAEGTCRSNRRRSSTSTALSTATRSIRSISTRPITSIRMASSPPRPSG